MISKEGTINEAIEILETCTPEERAAYLHRLRALVNTLSPWTKEQETVYNKNKKDF